MNNEQALTQCERDRELERTSDDNPINGISAEDYIDSLINEGPMSYALNETFKTMGLSEIPF